MAPTRRRKPEDDVDVEDEVEEERSPKAHRLSNGSRASTNGSIGSTAGGSPSPATDMEEEEEEEEEEEVAAPGSRGKGKGKRRAIADDDAAEEEEEEEEDEAGGESGGVSVAEKARRMAEICRQQDEEDRLNLLNGGGGQLDGDEDEGLQPPSSKKANKKMKKKKDGKDGKSSEAGIVLKIYVENFMCHRKLSVQLCRQVNFINGRNGSGKSAILAALQICLGAKAHLTHRAKKMADFIRHGWKGDAVLEVTLLNNEHGFKFEEYGTSITVRRTIKQPSGGGFALISQDGDIKSRDKAELLRMLDTFNIQVDNPCAVLDQENSKKFLQGSDEEKYAFFMKATDLERILADSEATGLAITKMRAGHHELLGTLPRYKEIVINLKAELKEYEALRALKEKIERLREELAWAMVNDREEILAESEEDVKIKNAEISRFNEKIAQLEQQIADIVAGKDEVKERFDAALAETQRLKKEAVEKGKELQAKQAPLLSLRSQRSSLESEKREKEATRRAATTKVKNAREMAKRTASDEKEKTLLEKLQRTEDSLFNVGRLKEGRGGDDRIFSLRTAVQAANDAAGVARENFENSNRDLAARKDELRTLESGKFDPLTAIGSFMPALVRRIQQEGRQFQSPPVGPLGASIQLKEEYKHFRICIEGHLSRNLTNFVVGSQQDKTKLMALMKDFRRTSRDTRWNIPTIIVQAPQARYRPPQNPPGCLQIMQAINITNDQAFNALVDQCSIEKNCVFTSKLEAEKVCLKGRDGRFERMPHGMFEAYYPSQGGKSCNKFNVSDGNLQTRTNVVNVRRHKSILGVDEGTQKQEVTAQVQQAAAMVEQAKATAHDMAKRANAAGAALQTEEAERDALERQESQLGREKSSLSTELMALQAKKNDATDPTEELERELQVATEELEDVVKQLESLEAQIIEVSATIDPFEKASENARKAHEESSEAAKKIHHELEEREARESEQSRKAVRAQALLAKLNGELEELSTRTKEAGDRVEKEEESAKQIMQNTRVVQGRSWDGQRLTPGASSEALRIKLDMRKERLEKQKQKRKLKSGSLEEVTERLMGATKHLLDMEDLADTLAANMKLLSDEKNRRLPQWKAMRDYVTRNLSDRFNKYLLKRGASGEVTIDHKEKTMGMAYQKDYMDDSNQCDDVRQLSGGERSSATLAMLLAIGESNECPFRVMDEFDVFMDPMSRNWAIKQVIEFAASQKIRQFIFITPQDLSSVTASETCRVIRMQPPRKGDHTQTTLEESFGGGEAS